MAEIVAFTGQSFAAVWQGMTWRDYRALNRHWRKWPPPAVSLAVMARLAPQLREDPDGVPPGALTGEDAIAFLSTLPGMGPPPQPQG